jgi:hypothetical protein
MYQKKHEKEVSSDVAGPDGENLAVAYSSSNYLDRFGSLAARRISLSLLFSVFVTD